MKTRKLTDKRIKMLKCEHHSNLALMTTVIALTSFVVLMLVYMGDHSAARVGMAIGASRLCGIAFWIAAAAFAVNAVRKNKKYLIEYIIYMIILGFGLFFMYSMPSFIYPVIEGTIIASNWARGIFRVLAVGSVVYFIISVGYHLVLATPGKNK